MDCKTITLRTRVLRNGMLGFYLDFYPGYRDKETMKVYRHKSIDIQIYANPKNQRERNFNAEMSTKVTCSNISASSFPNMTRNGLSCMLTFPTM